MDLCVLRRVSLHAREDVEMQGQKRRQSAVEHNNTGTARISRLSPMFFAGSIVSLHAPYPSGSENRVAENVLNNRRWYKPNAGRALKWGLCQARDSKLETRTRRAGAAAMGQGRDSDWAGVESSQGQPFPRDLSLCRARGPSSATQREPGRTWLVRAEIKTNNKKPDLANQSAACMAAAMHDA